MPSENNGIRDVLTQDEAEGRAHRVGSCAYRIHLDLTAGAPTYRGDVTIEFEALGEGDLSLNFRRATVVSTEINGRPTGLREEPWTLVIPAEAIEPRMSVRIVYENEYDHGGDGFHQFIDPEDGQEYLYSNFEPFEAHRLFPCFDQPDIKASYELSVTGPADWEYIANAREVSREPADDGRATLHFARTEPFSTYLFALVAGPYHRTDEEHEGIPLGLFCRRSLAKYLDAEEIFAVTKQGLTFYREFFDYAYPFGKYDQVFVPEFNAGAMENVGAVTHNEFIIFRDPPTERQRRERAEVILHEMAHMWFGDLVTMRWWNDLWLNESFATYMSFLCIEEATRFEGSWQEFNASVKNWAYRQDQLVTTHPIAGTVGDTDETFLNFDGITYGKGASVLKQLVAAIGMEGFREGMRRYFATYAFGNTTLEQFLGSLSEGSGQDLDEWSKLWLETSSVNTISAEIETDGERVTQLTLRQSAPAGYPTVRPHALDVGLLRLEDGRLVSDVIQARLDSESAEMAEARGRARPDLVVPNYGDHAYAKLALDPGSVAFLREHIDRVDDLLLRQLLWSALWNMVRDQQLSSLDFVELVKAKIGAEPNLGLLDAVLGNATQALGRYVPEALRGEALHAFFASVRESLRAAGEGEPQIIWTRTLIGVAANPEDIGYCAALADGNETIAGLELDQDMRWDIATKCVAYGMPGAQERVAAERERDPSDRGQRREISCGTAVPDASVKREAWERINADDYGSQYLTSAAMAGMYWHVQRELLEPYIDEYFERVPGIFERKDREFAISYARALFPGYRIEQRVLDASQGLLARLGEGPAMLVRALREMNDDLERAIRCREFVGDRK